MRALRFARALALVSSLGACGASRTASPPPVPPSPPGPEPTETTTAVADESLRAESTTAPADTPPSALEPCESPPPYPRCPDDGPHRCCEIIDAGPLAPPDLPA